MLFKMWLEAEQHVAVVDSKTADQRTFGNSVSVEDGFLVGWHVTDNPQKVFDALKSGKQLTASYRKGVGKYAELGPGLYVSGVPHFWMNRSTGKWNFLKGLAPDQKQKLADAIRNSRTLKGIPMGDGTTFMNVSKYEVETANRYIDQWLATDNEGIIVMLAGQPYNIPFWQPDFLKPLGIEPSPAPKKVKITFSGKFADLSNNVANWPVIADCIRKGYDGGFNPGGMVSNPELCIWRHECIRNAELDD